MPCLWRGQRQQGQVWFPWASISFCLVCGDWLKEECRAKDNQRIAERKQVDPDFKAAVDAAMRRVAARKSVHH